MKLHAEAPVLPGFSYDTGLQPPSGPAQMSLKLAAGGAIVVDAAGAVARGKLQGKPGGGKLKLDMHVKLEGRLKVDAGAVKYDGELPGVKNLDIPIGGDTTFDGFAMSGEAPQVVSNLPETKLPDIPLGSVPGHLELTVASGSTITTAYRSTCLEVKGGKATLKGETVTSGTLVLKAAVVLEVPLFKKTVELPPLTVAVPKSTEPLDVAADVPGLGDGTDGACGAGGGGEGTTPGSDGEGTTPGGGSNGPDAGMCKAEVETGSAACDACISGSCCTELTACANDADCYSLMACQSSCTSNVEACRSSCEAQHPSGATIYGKILSCAHKRCTAACQ